jgi:beta-glucosidase
MNTFRVTRAFLITSLFLIFSIACNKTKEIYKDPSADVENRVEDLLQRMTLEQKIAQLAGHGLATDADTVLGIPGLLMTDGPLGVRTEKATAFPCGEALAASWDTALISKVGKTIALEVKGKGLNMLLGPCVDIHRLPANGRNFEGYGEDPYLSSRLVNSYIKAVQNEKVVACVKHFVLENHQWERMKFDNKVDERALHEIYFPPFKTAIEEAKALSIMAAYNKINTRFGTENEYNLKTILKGEWQFKGLVVSDWDATHHTVDAANNGLDIEMPQPVHFGDSLLMAVKNGKVSENEINDKVKRVLRVKFTAGLFENSYKADSTLVNSSLSKSVALEAAKSGIILLKNEKNILPLDKTKIRSMAIIGPNAKKYRYGGGSSAVIPYYTVTPFDALKNKIGDNIILNYALGDELDKKVVAPIPAQYFFVDELKTQAGLKAEYFNNIELKGEPIVSRIDQKIDFNFNDSSPIVGKIEKDMFGIRWTGYLISPVPKKYKIATYADDGVRLYIDDKLQFENWDFHGTEKDSVEIFLDQNKPHKIVLEYFDGQMSGNIKLSWDHESAGSGAEMNSNNLIAEAVQAAKKSDVAILFLGSSQELESEATDYKDDLKLPNKQEELLKAVAKVNPNVIVVLNGGIPLRISDVVGNIKGLVNALYIGQEGGNALAELILGEYNPSAKLPFSYIKKSEDSYAWAGFDKKNYIMTYKEGIYVGYRNYEKNNNEVLYPFGFGLSYTSFEYSKLEVKNLDGNNFECTFKLKNTGKYDGSEIVQLYVSDSECSVDRPLKELKNFTKVYLKQGEETTIKMTLNQKSFEFYNPTLKKWTSEPGEMGIMIGASSADIKLNQKITIK